MALPEGRGLAVSPQVWQAISSLFKDRSYFATHTQAESGLWSSSMVITDLLPWPPASHPGLVSQTTAVSPGPVSHVLECCRQWNL